MKGLVLLLLLMGCTSYDDLNEIKSDKAACAKFKREYDSVGVTKPTKRIANKIQECQELGAW